MAKDRNSVSRRRVTKSSSEAGNKMKYFAILLLIAGCTQVNVSGTPPPIVTATEMATWTPTFENTPTIETFTETPTWTATLTPLPTETATPTNTDTPTATPTHINTPTPTATSTEVPLMAVAVTLGSTVQAATPIILTVIPSGLGTINVYQALCYARFFIYKLYPWQLIIVRDNWGYESCVHNWVRK